MLATGMFDNVTLAGLPEDYASAAGSLALAVIEPFSVRQEDFWDSTAIEGLKITSVVEITFLARNEDPQLRDEKVEQMMNAAINVIQGQNLAEITVPEHTRFTSAKWLKPKAPERRIITTFTYEYLQIGWGSYDTAE